MRNTKMNEFLVATLVGGVLQIPSAASAAPVPPAHGSSAESSSAAALKQDMRRLWTEHVIWTRDYIVAAVADQPDQQAAAARLMKNQDDIGAAVAAYYGPAGGTKLTALLKEHISIAVDLIKAAKAGDRPAQQRADVAWHRNAEDIADFLSKANPHWPRATLVDMMNVHLSTTTDEEVARLTKNWDQDVRAFDAVYKHIPAHGRCAVRWDRRAVPEQVRTSSEDLPTMSGRTRTMSRHGLRKRAFTEGAAGRMEWSGWSICPRRQRFHDRRQRRPCRLRPASLRH
jgi:hypothetical protein